MIKKYGPLVAMLLVVAALVVAFIFKDRLYDTIGKGMKESVTEEVRFEAEKYILRSFNYTLNRMAFDFTLLEFKSTGCSICTQMVPELEELKKWEDARIKVVLVQVMNPESQELMKYFGVSAVPTHILLDKTGTEFYRKYGFVSAGELKNQLLQKQ